MYVCTALYVTMLSSDKNMPKSILTGNCVCVITYGICIIIYTYSALHCAIFIAIRFKPAVGSVFWNPTCFQDGESLSKDCFGNMDFHNCWSKETCSLLLGSYTVLIYSADIHSLYLCTITVCYICQLCIHK